MAIKKVLRKAVKTTAKQNPSQARPAPKQLQSINDELHYRKSELNVLAQELSNLLLGVDIPVLVLDADLRVRRFTPVAATLLNLIPGDVGRPFTDIASNLDVPDWKDLFSLVIDLGQSIEREVRLRSDHRYSLRMRPSKTAADEIDGVLIVLLTVPLTVPNDVDAMRKSLDAASAARDTAVAAEARADAVLNSLTAHVCVLAADGTIVATNDAWNQFALENDAWTLHAVGLGTNYLEICRDSAAYGASEAGAALDGINSVLEGLQAEFQLEYPCHSLTELRWFLMSVSPLKGSKEGGAVIAHTNITERKYAEAELEKSSATVAALLESSTQSILAVDTGGKIVLANGNTEEMFGYTRPELVGQPFWILLPEDLREPHAALHKAYFSNMETRPMGTGLELTGRRKDGSAFPVEIGLSGIDSPLGKIAVAFVSDITARKSMEQALRRREREIRTVLDDNPDVIMRFDRQLRYIYVNAAVERVAHQPPEDFLGKTPVEMGRPRQMLDIWIPAMERALDTGLPETVQLTFSRPNVGTDWELRIIPEFASDGSVETLLVIGHDITEHKHLEKIAEASREEIRALAASLVTAQEEERRRVSRELHDQICQQLAALAFDLGSLAARPPRPVEARAQLKALQSRAVKASEETRHIAYELHPSVLDDLGLETSLRDLCNRFSAKTGNIAVQFDSSKLPSPIPREIASCLYRIAQESLNNISAHSGAKRASLELAALDGTLRLTVNDNGVGFDLSVARGQGGLGLIGMEERSRMVNGKLTISSQPGHGTTIALDVPLGSVP